MNAAPTAVALATCMLLAGCTLFQPETRELDLDGVPFTPFVRLHFFANGTAADHTFRVSNDASNFTWAVKFSAPRADQQSVCASLPGARPTVRLTDPSGQEVHVVELPPEIAGSAEGCGPEIRKLMPGTPGFWRVRITGQGNVLGAVSAS